MTVYIIYNNEQYLKPPSTLPRLPYSLPTCIWKHLISSYPTFASQLGIDYYICSGILQIMSCPTYSQIKIKFKARIVNIRLNSKIESYIIIINTLQSIDNKRLLPFIERVIIGYYIYEGRCNAPNHSYIPNTPEVGKNISYVSFYWLMCSKHIPKSNYHLFIIKKKRNIFFYPPFTCCRVKTL